MKLNTLVLLTLFIVFSAKASAQVFQAQGSDLIMGVGAKNIAMAGASTANTNDIYSIFYNPAGLSELKSNQFSFSSQLDGQLTYVNFLGMAFILPIESLNLKLTLAFAYIPRLYMEASGSFREDEFESVFLRYTLSGLYGDFIGDVYSETDEYRFAMALSPLYNPFWSVGASAGYVNCATTFGGVTMEDTSNFIYMSTVAKTVSFNLGAKYYLNEDITLGLSMKNLDSKLTVEVDRKDDNGESIKNYDVDVPYDFSAGIDYIYTEDINFALDYQQIFGAYGEYNVDFRLLRFGSTLKSDTLDYHVGLIAPIVLDVKGLSGFKMPFPLSPTLGLGWHKDAIDVSFAFYFHPVMSINKGEPSPSVDLSVNYNF